MIDNVMIDNSTYFIARKAAQYDALVQTLFDGATLATKMTPYDPDDIYIDCFDIRILLKAFEPERYADAVEFAKAKDKVKKRIMAEEAKAKEAADGAAD